LSSAVFATPESVYYGAGPCCGGCREESGEVEGVSVGGGGEPSPQSRKTYRETGKGCWAPKGVLDTILG